MSSKVELQNSVEFLILKGIHATKQEGMNELNTKKEGQSLNETTHDGMLRLFEENARLRNELCTLKDELLASRNELLTSRNELLASRNELFASKDEQIKSIKTIGEQGCKNVQLKNQLVMAKEKIKEQATRINQFEKEKSPQQQEMNSIKLNTQQQQLDNATKQNEINDMEKQLHQTKEELKEAQEKHAKAEEELIQKQLELDNCTKELEQQKEELDNRTKEAEQQKEELNNRTKEVEQQKEELDNRTKEAEQQKEELDNRTKEVEQQRKELDNKKKELDTREVHLDEKHKEEATKLNTRINEYITKQKEYDTIIIVLSHALSRYGTHANYVIEESKKTITVFSDCNWTTMQEKLDASYASIRRYLHENLTNSISKEKMLIDTIIVYNNN